MAQQPKSNPIKVTQQFSALSIHSKPQPYEPCEVDDHQHAYLRAGHTFLLTAERHWKPVDLKPFKAHMSHFYKPHDHCEEKIPDSY